jgi:hypothetical protein
MASFNKTYKQHFTIFNTDQLVRSDDLYILEQRHFASTHSIWCVDESYFSTHTVLFILICVKTTAILGTVYTTSSQDTKVITSSEAILDLYNAL